MGHQWPKRTSCCTQNDSENDPDTVASIIELQPIDWDKEIKRPVKDMDAAISAAALPVFQRDKRNSNHEKYVSPLLQLNLNHRVTGSIRDQLYFPPLPSLLRAAGGDSRCRGGRAAAHH